MHDFSNHLHARPAKKRKGKHMPTYKDEKTNTWYCKFYYVNWQGEKKQKMKRGFKLQREAKDFERKFLEQFAKNPDITFETLYDKFCTFKKGRIRDTTLQGLCYRIERNILPHFRDLVLSQITPEDIARWQSTILEKGYSPAHCRQLNADLSELFNYAVKYLGLSKNPVINQICKPPKPNINFWTFDEYKRFRTTIEGNIAQLTAFDILYFTGIRKGELLALTLGDVDFENCTISITKTLKNTRSGIVINPPKTEKSNRIIDIPGFLINEIQLYANKIYGIQKEDRLFHRAENWIHITIRDNYEKAGVKRIRAHDIRHSHASLLINLGANPLMIAERLGHEDIKMTLNTYAHLFESHKQDIIEKLENVKL